MATTVGRAVKPEKVKFKRYKNEDFFPVLKKRVEEHFCARRLPYHGTPSLYFKGLILTLLYIGFYAAILSNSFGLLGLVVLYGLLGITKGMIGFNVIHDALHGSYTASGKINRVLGYWFDLNGTSSYVWKITHNVLHHTYTNIPGHDDDIDKAILLRLNPTDRIYWFHRFQNWYAPILYSIVSLNWVFYSDYAWFYKEAREKKVPRMEILLFLTFKALNLLLFLLLPLYLLTVPWWYVALGYLSMHVFGGILISIVFQLAHIVDNVHYFEPDQEGNMEYNWALHELLTTSNFGTGNKLLTQLVGGLNFQVEHHLFPNICHVHFHELQTIVKAAAQEFGLPYYEQPTLYSAVLSHFSTLKKLGRGNALKNVHSYQ